MAKGFKAALRVTSATCDDNPRTSPSTINIMQSIGVVHFMQDMALGTCGKGYSVLYDIHWRVTLYRISEAQDLVLCAIGRLAKRG